MKAAALGLIVGLAATPAAAITLESISAPAKYVSGCRVLVRLTTDGGRPLVTLNGRDVSGAFVARAPKARYEALLEGLTLGESRLVAKEGGERADLSITNHPVTGPMFSGPHMSPFICQTQDFKLPDGRTLGPAADADCSAPTVVQYVYKPKGSDELKPLANPARTPADADRIGARPFVVRVETGTLNRAIYQFAVLHDPSTDDDVGPFAAKSGWNRKLIALHGTGCTRGWNIQGAALGAKVLDTGRLGEGFALFSSTLNHPTNSCNPVLAGETTTMVKQRVIEALGVPLYTLSMGGSGGAYTSLQLADAYPGLFDGIVINSTFPDALAITIQASDARLLARYFRETAPGAFTPEQQQAVGGYGSPAALAVNANQSARADPVAGRRDGPGYNSAQFNEAVPEALRYDPKTNPKGARPTVFDWASNIYGRDPATGAALRPFDNVGVQYGLAALRAGTITPAQFLDLNARIGGFDRDANYTGERSTGDAPAIRAAYERGLLLSGAGGLKEIPVLDFGGIYSDLEPAGEYHLKHHHFSVRERMKRWNGSAPNHVIWSGGLGIAARREPEKATAGERALAEVMAKAPFEAMDAWLMAIAGDPGPGSRLEKALRHRPAAVVDGCWTAEASPRFIAEPQAATGDSACNRLYPAFSYPRGVAGEPLSADVLKCALRPAKREDYPGFTDAEFARLEQVFRSGVCDWSKLGAGQRPVATW